MRARNIKPGFFKNEILGQADPFLSLTFQGLWCLADREGRLENRPLRIKAEIFPYRYDLNINGYLTELSRLDFICIYEVNGVEFIEVKNFKKHQAPHNTEKKSCLPENPSKPNTCRLTVKPPLPNSEYTPDLLIPDSLIHTNTVGSEAELNRECDSEFPEEPENTSGQEPEAETSVKRNDYPEDFNTFFRAWPHTNGSKKKAFQAWKKARDKPALEKLLSLVDMLRKSDKWQRGIIPHPETWLNGKRWETAEDIQPAGTKPAAEDFTPKEFDPKTLYGDDFDARTFYASA